jgi:hypothetical protein
MLCGVMAFGRRFSLRTPSVPSVCWLVIAACGNQEWRFDAAATVDAAAAVDAAVDAASARDADSPDAAPCTVCGDGERCKAGGCECLPSRTRCGTQCVAVVSDPSHCGACDVACAANEACRGGVCQ